MSYRTEFAAHWQALTAACLGMSVGLALNHYVLNLFAPELISAFGWSRSKYALLGASPFLTMFLIPFAGRFTDRVGPRRAAAVGFAALPLGYLALSFMNGSFGMFFAINVFNSILGVLTTTMVFARVIVERFDRARGVCLSLVMSGAPLAAALAIPLMTQIIDEHGWRMGFRVLAVISAVGGIITVALLREHPQIKADRLAGPPPKITRQHIAKLLGSRALLLSMGGMLLVNIPQSMATSQLKLVLMENGALGGAATALLSMYAASVVLGRFLSGLALDRFPAHLVAGFTLAMPAVGLLIIASPFDQIWLLTGAVLLIALAQGAEGDIGAYVISRKLAIEHYSLLTSFMTVALTLGVALGSLVLSYTLHLADNYEMFLVISAAASVVGAWMFYRTGAVEAATR